MLAIEKDPSKRRPIMERRDFIKTTLAAAIPAAAAGSILHSCETVAAAAEPQSAGDLATPASEKSGEMLYRALGKTGEKVSIIGLGGYHIGIQRDEQESIRIIRSAIDGGVTFMDNCWDYNHGASETRMGKALQDGYRKRVFLMTKIDGRNQETAARQIDESLKRLQTDCIDLLQHHEIIRMEDPDRIFAAGGAMEAVVAAQKAGKVRFIGFTGHKDPLVHLRMLEIAEKHNFRFDAVQMPINVMDAHFRSFGKHVVPVLVKEEIGVLGMKPMGSGEILRSKTVTPIECLHYAMTMPTSVIITGIDSIEVLKQDLEAVRTFKPLTSDEIAAILKKTAVAAADGQYEGFKTTNHYDSTALNPQFLG
jgi:predicted aldo/keto reductase-like oxidoreductase